MLTGALGSGKTTLLSHLFLGGLPGITSWAEPYQSVFMKDNLTGRSVKIAEYDDSIQGTKQKMVLVGDELETFGISVLQACMESDSPWVSIDEIGFLEETCASYKDAIRALFEQKQVAAVVRKQDLPFLMEIRNRNDVFVVDLDRFCEHTGCVIMASGLGKRFGGNKLMADFGGKPMIHRALEVTDGLFSRRVVVTRHESVARLCREWNVEVVLHDLPHRSDTVRLGLEALGELDVCMFIPGDQPLLRRETVAMLLEKWRENPDRIIRPVFEENEGSPVLFPAWAFPELKNLPEGKGGGVVIKKHPGMLCRVPVKDPFELADADTPETLEMLKGICHD